MTVFAKYQTVVIFTRPGCDDLDITVHTDLETELLMIDEFLTLCRAEIRNAYQSNRIDSCKGWELFEVLPSKAVSYTADDKLELIYA